MEHGVARYSIIPCRAEPSERAEMVTQLLFGETYSVLEKKKSWLQISGTHDSYPCWINEIQHTKLTEEEFQTLAKGQPLKISERTAIIRHTKTEEELHLTMGALIHDKNSWQISGSCISESQPLTALPNLASQFLTAPYLWGGRSTYGVDCSGFVQVVYSLLGIRLPRDAHPQASFGETINLIDFAQMGDLAFFDNEEGRITHVGIILNENKIIHASGKVRIDSIDHEGIHNAETKRYSHRLRILKRVFPVT